MRRGWVGQGVQCVYIVWVQWQRRRGDNYPPLETASTRPPLFSPLLAVLLLRPPRCVGVLEDMVQSLLYLTPPPPPRLSPLQAATLLPRSTRTWEASRRGRKLLRRRMWKRLRTHVGGGATSSHGKAATGTAAAGAVGRGRATEGKHCALCRGDRRCCGTTSAGRTFGSIKHRTSSPSSPTSLTAQLSMTTCKNISTQSYGRRPSLSSGLLGMYLFWTTSFACKADADGGRKGTGHMQERWGRWKRWGGAMSGCP